MNITFSKKLHKNSCFAFLIAFYLLFSFQSAFAQTKEGRVSKREFRAVWIATIANIDWPSRSDLTVKQQKDEFISLLDRHQRNGINAVVVQVRPSADAFYKSSIEPWSEWLSGKQGKAPIPFYDPMQFMIEESHKRGMEFHAWVNPFRAVSNVESNDVHSLHITKRKPDWFVVYGKTKFFNPGIPEVRYYVTNVIEEIVKNYNIDALHFDDYFYPYPDLGNTFGDLKTFNKYKNGHYLRASWRRNNINIFVKGIHKMIAKVKPQLKFGISPFGVWRNEDMSPFGSKSSSGYTSYDHLYADVRLWLQKGWIDYVAPQLYQNTYHKKNPYKNLVNWWSDNSYGKHLYIGHASYRLFDKNSDYTWYSNNEMPRQLRYNRKFSNVFGSIFFSSKSLLKNQGHIGDSLRLHFYKYPAIIPTMPWKDAIPPLSPMKFHSKTTAVGVALHWQTPLTAPDGETASQYVLYRFDKEAFPDLDDARNILEILPAGRNFFIDQTAQNSGDYDYCITSLDKLNNESNPSLAINLDAVAPIPKEPETILVNGEKIEIETIKFLSELLVLRVREHLGFR